jgi:hypothetical protein
MAAINSLSVNLLAVRHVCPIGMPSFRYPAAFSAEAAAS